MLSPPRPPGVVTKGRPAAETSNSSTCHRGGGEGGETTETGGLVRDLMREFYYGCNRTAKAGVADSSPKRDLIFDGGHKNEIEITFPV